MKYRGFVLIFTIILVVGFSCNKENLLGEYYLPEELKSFNPFKGHEILRFQSKNGIIELNGGDRINELNRKYAYYPDDYYLCEGDYISFANTNFSLGISMEACYTKPDAEGIRFRFKYLNNDYSFSSYFRLLPNDDATKYYDSLLISESWIYEVFYDTMNYVFHDKPFPYEDHVYPLKSYYSKSHGVVKIDFSDNTTWELQEIIW